MVFELAGAQRRLGADVEIWTPDAIRAALAQQISAVSQHVFKHGLSGAGAPAVVPR